MEDDCRRHSFTPLLVFLALLRCALFPLFCLFVGSAALHPLGPLCSLPPRLSSFSFCISLSPSVSPPPVSSTSCSVRLSLNWCSFVCLFFAGAVKRSIFLKSPLSSEFPQFTGINHVLKCLNWKQNEHDERIFDRFYDSFLQNSAPRPTCYTCILLNDIEKHKTWPLSFIQSKYARWMQKILPSFINIKTKKHTEDGNLYFFHKLSQASNAISFKNQKGILSF